MWCGKIKKTQEEVEATQLNLRIEREIKETKHQPLAMKLLLLGTGDSGKSTFAKQLTMEYSTNTVNDDMYIPVLHDNVMTAIMDLINFVELNNNSMRIPNFEQDACGIKGSQVLTPAVATIITRLYKTAEMQDIITKYGSSLQLQGGVCGAHYFLSNCERFSQESYRPTKKDILMARRKTTGIIETSFTFSGAHITLVDVGGQRSERRKWLHCFSAVTAVIFLSALDEYDMVLEEDVKTNRLVETLKLWKALTSSQFFKTTPFILFLNKSDLFREKIQVCPLRNVFQDYLHYLEELEGKEKMDEFEISWRYFVKHFKQHFYGKEFFPHVTCAIDTEACKKVFESVQQFLMQRVINENTCL
eukprot:TRINITY_DN4879_c0_g1_i9.p1 TRINITY_DN4879_c0_g1~~TRINITY_DN4879_c0_g1_i9.p1  ORF type:complete len:360 (-),score=64.67 TRINITY_DN4879_c0_g1_i9:61-1140(-)